MALHQVFSPRLSALLQRSVGAQDCVLLIGDALYAVEEFCAWRPVLVRAKDAHERGLSLPSCQVIDEAQWVALCLEHQPVVSWRE